MTVDWSPLRAELAIWRAEARELPLWWRDDDAIEPTPALERLTKAGKTAGIPVHLAVIPAHATQALVDYTKENSLLRPVVHGWAHVNHAPADQKSSEFGTPRAAAQQEAAAGFNRLQTLFGAALIPLFVPPWNRVDQTLLPKLPGLGYRAISTYGPRKNRLAAPGLTQVNTHIDPVEWRGTRGLADPEQQIAWLVAHLAARRTGEVDATEALGLLTHHLMQDDATWDFCAALMQELQAAPIYHYEFKNEKETP